MEDICKITCKIIKNVNIYLHNVKYAKDSSRSMKVPLRKNN